MAGNISTQLRKGVLQGMILMILDKEPDYGYELMKKISDVGLGVVPKGTIYPLLTNMLTKKLLTQTAQESADGRVRKYYFITELGREEKNAFIKEWQSINDGMSEVIRRNQEE